MLVLTRGNGDRIVIADNIVLTVVRLRAHPALWSLW
jgi:sRNA-binding carbon storage regulator CsrA